ncbi:hypothetical protein KI387_016417 [Taxus chinensis]|uniref:Hexosyltransferase n=1 Tax=Taxus chinensis TaxID=29808 RepID=A0AA38GHP2_TAXCH|nr:hypothetical protein KI387_016417 [Taxus chinensis]
MVYMDADIQVFDNIDNLFHMSDGYLYAVMDCFCEKTWSHTPQYNIGYCQQCPDKVCWPAEMEKQRPALYFNAGMFAFEPSKLTFDSMMETLMSTAPTPVAEQKMYIPIPLVYNLVLAMLWRHPENVDVERVKVAHYCAAVSVFFASACQIVYCCVVNKILQTDVKGSKPWKFTGKEPNMQREDIQKLVKKWWEIYNDDSMDFRSNETRAETESRSELQHITDKALRGVMYRPVHVLPAPPAA